MKFKRYLPEILVVLAALLVVLPVLYHGVPLYASTPDVLYVKAKLLQVEQGKLYADPVTGIDTLHPPFYHLFLTPFKLIGFDIDTILIIIVLLNISLYFFFTYKLIRGIWNRKTAALTCLLFVFIFDFMGAKYILLPTSFYFSVSFYLAGLWLYTSAGTENRRRLWAAFLWGIAFLVSPVYVFLLAATFIYDFVVGKNWRRSLAMVGVFVITISPFFYQAISIYSRDLAAESTFALWRGFFDSRWLKDFVIEFLSPVEHNIVSIPVFIHAGILLLFIIGWIRSRKIHWFIVIAFLAYCLTYYHFTPNYAIRIQLFLSLFIAASAMSFLLRLRLPPAIIYLIAGAVSLYSYYRHYDYTFRTYEAELTSYVGYYNTGRDLWTVLGHYLDDNRYIFCSKTVYLQFVMPYQPVHALGAHKTLKYYQVSPKIAQTLEKDYNTVIHSSDYDSILAIADKYDIQKAVVSGNDMQYPLFKTLADKWSLIYRDKYFAILQRP